MIKGPLGNLVHRTLNSKPLVLQTVDLTCSHLYSNKARMFQVSSGWSAAISELVSFSFNGPNVVRLEDLASAWFSKQTSLQQL